ncbi:MAG: SusC/RagA family TonB-linked outer membrane protein [Chitinophagaceae bacterium]
MKLIAILLFAATIQVSAKGYAQLITVSGKNISLEKVFKQIERQSKYVFFYDEVGLQQAGLVNIDVKNATLNEVLEVCFKDQPLYYNIVGKTIVINKADQKQEENIIASPPPVEVRGTVSNEAGKPMQGVSILVKGTNKGTSTKADGSFTINANAGDMLEFTFVGYQKREVTVGQNNNLSVIMEIESAVGSEIVVIGYGSAKKKTITGAVVQVKAENLDFSNSTTFQSALNGKVAGLQITQSSGQPGASVGVQIRSNPTANSAGVLYVIDGVPIVDAPSAPGTNSRYGGAGVSQSILNSINPNDIESIQVLKDASSASIYGARAGSSVILITTKKGRRGATTINYSGSYAFEKAANVFPQFNAFQYQNIRNNFSLQKWYSDNKIGPFFGTADSATVAATKPYVPYYTAAQLAATTNLPSALSQVLRNGYINQQNISMSGGNEKTSYFISGNYFDQKGTVIATGMKRYNGLVRIDENISPKLKAGVNLIGSNSNTQNAVYGGTFENSGVIPAAQNWPANQPLKNPDGTYPINNRYAASPNPLSYQLNNDHTTATRLLSMANVEYEIINDLKAKAIFSYDQQDAKRNYYSPSAFLYSSQGTASITDNSSNTLLLNYTLSYQHTFAQKHAINAVIGYEYNKTNGENVGAGNRTFFSDIIGYYNLGLGQSARPSVSSYQYTNSWASYVARGIYTYDNRLSISASINRNGSTAFAAGKKWGYFPSVGATYIIFDGDNSMVKAINYLKLRVGYGETGNPPSSGSAFAQYGPRVSPTFGTSSTSTAIYLTQAANSNLSWETVAEINVGLDYGLFNDRITGSIDVFNKTIKNLITNIPLPSDFLVGSITGNAGSTRDRGYEFLVNTKNIVPANADGLRWSSSLTFSHYFDFWVERSAGALKTLPKYVATSGPQAAYYGIYGYESAGLYTGTKGAPPATMPGIFPGGLIIKDIHGYDATGNLTGPDGAITGADQTLIANSRPKFNFSIGNDISYKNFQFSIFFAGQKLKKYASWGGAVTGLQDQVGQGWNAYYPEVNNRWTTFTPNASIPSGLIDPKYNGYQNASDYYYIDATFLRCQDIKLGYNLPDKILGDRKTIKRINISFDVNNAFLITKYPYLDPQISQGSFYPLNRGFIIGINAGL